MKPGYSGLMPCLLYAALPQAAMPGAERDRCTQLSTDLHQPILRCIAADPDIHTRPTNQALPRNARAGSCRFSNVDLPSTLPDRKHHATKGEEGSAHGGARHSRLGRQVSGRESSSPG